MSNENWWTLNEEEVKVKPSQKVKKTSKKSSKKSVESGARFYKDDVAVAAAFDMESKTEDLNSDIIRSSI